MIKKHCFGVRLRGQPVTLIHTAQVLECPESVQSNWAKYLHKGTGERLCHDILHLILTQRPDTEGIQSR